MRCGFVCFVLKRKALLVTMLLNPCLAKTLGINFFTRSSTLKFTSLLKRDEIFVRKKFSVINTFLISNETIYKPFHTLSCQAKMIPEKHDYSSNVFLQDDYFTDQNRTFESKNSKVLTVFCLEDLNKTSDLYYCDDFFISQEFKNALSQSMFHYDVRLVNYISSEQLSSLPKLNDRQHRHFDSDITGHSFDFRNSGLILAENSNTGSDNHHVGPTEEQLLTVTNYLCYSLLNFFRQAPDYSLYHKDVIFQNNIKGVTVKGISAYTQQMYLLKIYGHLHYAKVNVDILKITHHTEDGTVRVRWRASGVSRSKILLLFWKLKDWSWEKFVSEESEWLDGFSIFSVNQSGLIYKHVCDKMIPDNEELQAKPHSFRTKLLALLGLSHRPHVGNLNAMLAYSSLEQCNQAFNLPHKAND